MKITFLFRKKLAQNNSIEELFNSIIKTLPQYGMKISRKELPYHGASISSIIRNIKFSRRINSELTHITGDVHYSALGVNGKKILTIHDIKSALTGNAFKRIIIRIFWFYLPAIFVERIITISEFSKKELLEIIPFAKKKIVVIHNPVNSDLKKLAQENKKLKPVILHLGTKSNKNLEGTINGIKNIDCQLVIIGKINIYQKSMLLKYNIDFRNLFHVPYNTVIKEYQNSDIVCFPSFYEGFGMPIIEAQKIGRPVVTSNLASMPEVAGEGAYFVNPFKSSEIEEAILTILNDTDYRNELIEKGFENVKRFEMDIIIEQYLELYKSIVL